MPDPERSTPVVVATVATFTHEYPLVREVVRWVVVCPFCGSKHLHSPVAGTTGSHCDDLLVRGSYVIEAPGEASR